MWNLKRNKKILVTHDGSFHADDVFACATLAMVLERKGKSFKVVRTRNEEAISSGDYVFDVGGIYDETADRFDHHQKGGAGKRKDGIEYASFGLVWKKFGKTLCGSSEAAEAIDKRLAAPIDAFDNGIDLVENRYDVSPYFIQHFFLSMVPTWKEAATNDEMFLKCIPLAREILAREITQVNDAILAEDAVRKIYLNTNDRRVIVLDKRYPYEYVINAFPEPLFVIYPRTDGLFGVKTVRQDSKTFKNRKDFPLEWGGLKNEDLAKVSGVPDAIFCHRGLFMAVAKTKEGAIRLAELALKN